MAGAVDTARRECNRGVDFVLMIETWHCASALGGAAEGRRARMQSRATIAGPGRSA
jgi:hypothetical protein